MYLLPNVVNFAREFMNVSLAKDIPLWDANCTEYMIAFKQSLILVYSSDFSRICDNVPSNGPHVTSNIGLITSEGATKFMKSFFSLSSACFVELCTGRCLRSCSDALIISSFSFLNFSRFRSVALVRKLKKDESKEYISEFCAFIVALASSSSFREKGFF